ncbi:hypothetical protein [uncultured Roseibium sp.]|uniref:hypothetical protein n=1 Tax=uncultured Roseibium sp. TaxID=1936171 RepID=UPI0026094496|nr:hypothetical protein [uncultured Roseibium sp.]
MICTLIASSILLSVGDGSMAVLIPEDQSVRIFNESTATGETAVVHLYGETKIQLPGVTAQQVIEALKTCGTSSDSSN